MDLKNKVALVTGGSTGIGLGISMLFLKLGAKVITCARNEQKLKKAQEKLFLNSFGNLDYFIVNIENKSEVDNMFKYIIEKYGTLDILVNNAGVTDDVQFYKMTEEQWDKVININLKGTFNCCKPAVEIMKENNYGKIINISSSSGLDGNFGQTNYSAAKAGIIGMSKSLAKELGKNNINVNVIVPGVIETEMIEKVPEKVLDMWKARTPLRKLGTPEDIAKTCAFLASDYSNFITGEVIRVSGGFTL